MRGKVTYRHPQPSRIDTDVTIPLLSAATLDTLAKSLGRALDEREQLDVARAVESARFWRQSDAVKVSAADCRATLRALAKEGDASAAIAKCDVTTRALVQAELDHHIDFAIDAIVRTAARAALEHFPPVGGAQPTPLRMLAGNVAHLWREFGGSGGFTVKDDYASRGVRFAIALFEAAGEHRTASAVAKLLRESAAGQLADTLRPRR